MDLDQTALGLNRRGYLRVCLAQINTTVGDLAGNQKKIVRSVAVAKKSSAQLILFPEMTLTGYPPEDLLFKKDFIQKNLQALKSLLPLSRNILVLVGFVDRDSTGAIYNAAAALYQGKQIGCYRKVQLPNYGVFDEKRYFNAGDGGKIIHCGGLKIGLSICEDIWQPQSFVYQKPYRGGLSLLVNLSASPYHRGKQNARQTLLRNLAKKVAAPVLYNNLLGGQDELVFDGGGLIVSAQGAVLGRTEHFKEQILIADIPVLGHTRQWLRPRRKIKPRLAKPLKPEQEVYQALVLGTRDYIQKNDFKKALIGLSGGIDSALVAQIAHDAIGANNVVALTMPSRFTSPQTRRDAHRVAKRLKIRCLEISIEKPHQLYLNLLSPFFKKSASGSAEENIQARIRGTLLMAMSNKFGYLVLTTGNKSELATGYCTLYGDMAGGFAVIKDVPKTLVFRLAHYRNKLSPQNSIPLSILRRPPTAELKANQRDQDHLPPYGMLDAILERYVEHNASAKDLRRDGFSSWSVKKVLRMVDLNEYKRRQSPLGIKISPRAFGRDRRMPITHRYQS